MCSFFINLTVFITVNIANAIQTIMPSNANIVKSKPMANENIMNIIKIIAPQSKAPKMTPNKLSILIIIMDSKEVSNSRQFMMVCGKKLMGALC